MDKYTLEFLSEAFRNHELEYMASDRYDAKEFNLPKAFKTIVDEIYELRQRLVVEMMQNGKLRERVKSLESWNRRFSRLTEKLEKSPCTKQDK